jgi:hypothetical protein
MEFLTTLDPIRVLSYVAILGVIVVIGFDIYGRIQANRKRKERETKRAQLREERKAQQQRQELREQAEWDQRILDNRRKTLDTARLSRYSMINRRR